MSKLKLICFSFFACIITTAGATTWDEPWQDQVIKQADYFVLARVISFNTDSGVTVTILKSLGGKSLSGTIKITDFYSLHLCSRLSGEGPEFHFKGVDSCYFFIKQDSKNNYCIATPTAGYAVLHNGNVSATYRHSYHQARVVQAVYEETMSAIFNNYHGLPYDKGYIDNFISKYISLKPAGLTESELPVFFNQHVALECIYHLGLTSYYDKIVPFLKDTANFHAQISAVRALTSYNTAESKQLLLTELSSGKTNDFLKVLCIWTLKNYKPTELKPQLAELEKNASTEENGFGGNIMDPRICTHIPTVKDALTDLIKTI